MDPDLVSIVVVPPFPTTRLPLTEPEVVSIRVSNVRLSASLLGGQELRSLPIWSEIEPDVDFNFMTAGLSPGCAWTLIEILPDVVERSSRSYS